MNGSKPTETARMIAAAAAAGVTACLLDGLAAAGSIAGAGSGRAAGGLAMLLLASLAAGGGVAALLGAGVLLERLARSRWLRGVLVAAPIAIPLALFSLDLLAGARVSQVAMIGLLRVVVFVVTYAVVVVVTATWIGSRERSPRFLLVVATIAIAVACAVIDGKAMIGLYPSFHHALRLACLALGACVGYGCAPMLGRVGRGIGVAGLCALVVLPVLAATDVLPGRNPWARRVLLVWSRTAGPILQRITPVEIADDGEDDLLAAGPIEPAPPAALDAAFPGRRQFDVVWITIDTLRADRLSAYGYARKTSPALEALARESVLFERAYAQHPSSSLSFLSMLTSRYPSFYADRRGSPPKDLGPLLAGLREGRRLLAITPLQRGYVDRVMPYLIPGLAGIETIGRAQIPDASRVFARARELMEEPGTNPTIAFIHLFDPHKPYHAHRKTDTFPASRRSDPDSKRYDAEVAWADHHLGRFIEWMRARPSWNRTVVVIGGDHGESLGEYGMADHGTGLWEQQIHVPLIVRVPGAAARRVDDPVELIDVLPTLEALVGAEADGARHGHSLVGHLLPEARRDEIARPEGYAYVQFIRDGESLDAVVQKRWKLVRNHGAGIDRLYDLSREDPEAHDLALDDASVLDDLRAQAAAFRRLAQAASVVPTPRRSRGEAGTRVSRLQRHSVGVYRGDPEAAARLAALVREDPGDSNGHLALRRLSLLSPATAFPLLKELAANADTSLRVQVTAWLALGEQPGSRQLLGKLAGDASTQVADAALAGLALLGDARGTKRLLAVRPTNPEAGRWHLAARAAIDDSQALATLGSLVMAANAGPESLLAAWIAGRDHPETGIHADLYLRAANPSSDPLTRFALARRLGQETDAQRVAPILRALLDQGGGAEAIALRGRAAAALKRVAPRWAAKLERVEVRLSDMRAAAQAMDLPAARAALEAARLAATDETYVDWGLVLEERIVANAADRVRFPWPDTNDVVDDLLARPRAQDSLPTASTIDANVTIDSGGAWVNIELSAQAGSALAGGFHLWGPYIRVALLNAGAEVLHEERLPLPSRGIGSDAPLLIVLPIERKPGASALRVQVVIPGDPPLLTRRIRL